MAILNRSDRWFSRSRWSKEILPIVIVIIITTIIIFTTFMQGIYNYIPDTNRAVLQLICMYNTCYRKCYFAS